MANDVLKLTWASDGEADEAEMNLLDFVQGLTLDEGGWIPQVAIGDQATVTETMTFHARALTHDQLAGYVQVLDDWITRVAWSQDYTQRQFVWLNARWKSEANIRRAVVYSLAYSLDSDSSPYGVYVRDDSFVPALTVVITRGAYWEDDGLTQIELTGINGTGGKDYLMLGLADYVAIGDAPSRISVWRVGYGESDQLRYFWFGFRSSRNGVLSNFESLWELEDSSYLLADTTVVVDATASGGNKLVTTFASGTSLIKRAGIRTTDVTVNVNDQRGSYICLLRAKMSDTSIARVRASSGFLFNPYVINPRITTQGTAWKLYNLGLVRVPAIQREQNGMGIIAQAAITLDAERVSGSGNLEMDCLILIPYNDAYIDADNGGATGVVLYITNPPDFSSAAFSVEDVRQSSVNSSSWGLPANNEAPLIVAAVMASSTHDLTDEVSIVAQIVPRWRTLRGTE